MLYRVSSSLYLAAPACNVESLIRCPWKVTIVSLPLALRLLWMAAVFTIFCFGMCFRGNFQLLILVLSCETLAR